MFLFFRSLTQFHSTPKHASGPMLPPPPRYVGIFQMTALHVVPITKTLFPLRPPASKPRRARTVVAADVRLSALPEESADSIRDMRYGRQLLPLFVYTYLPTTYLNQRRRFIENRVLFPPGGGEKRRWNASPLDAIPMEGRGSYRPYRFAFKGSSTLPGERGGRICRVKRVFLYNVL